MIVTQSIDEIANLISTGGVIAYPTEAVFGLGCDPRNLTAVQRLLDIKHRPSEKGLILIASDFEQLKPFLDQTFQVSKEQSKPNNITWVFPAKSTISPLVRGDHKTLAVRVTKHPLVRELCEKLNSPIVSTSANITGGQPCHSTQAVLDQFHNHQLAPDAILDGPTGGQLNPTEIRDAISGKILRHS